MTRVIFTSNLRRHVDCPEAEGAGATVREARDALRASDVTAAAELVIGLASPGRVREAALQAREE